MNNIAYITELNDSNFDTIIKSNKIVIVDIWASWCRPCAIISPIIDEISADFNGKVLVGKLDADQNKETISSLGIRNIPTILIYKDGQIVDKKVGVISKQSLTEVINTYL